MSNPHYRLVCFDLDGTLVDDTIFIWKTLHEAFNTDAVLRARARDDFFAGRIDYDHWFATDLELLKRSGADKASMRQIICRLAPMQGARELLVSLRQRGHRLAVISGSLGLVIDLLFGRDLFDHVLINHIFFDSDGQINGGRATPYDLEGKAAGLREVARLEQIPLSATLFVGDNYNDLWIARAAGRAIAFNCKSDELRAVCAAEVLTKNLRDLGALIW